MKTFQTQSQDRLPRRPVREPASRGGAPDDEGWGALRPGEAQWRGAGPPTPRQVRGSRASGSVCSRQMHRIPQRAFAPQMEFSTRGQHG